MTPTLLLLHIPTSPTLLVVPTLLLLPTILLLHPCCCCTSRRQGQLLLLLHAARANALCAVAFLHPLRHCLLCTLGPLLIKLMC
jgi:hypothetical protein